MTAGSDNFADAPTIGLNVVSEAFSNIGYTIESGEDASTQNPALNPASDWFGATWAFKRSAWWTFTAPSSGNVQVHAQRSAYTPPVTYDPDVLVSVYTGTSLGALTLVGQGSLGDSAPTLGNTTDYTPWVANFGATSGTTYYIRFASIYDEDIDYRLTVVPTPTSLTGTWLDGEPVDIDITDPTYAQQGVSTQAVGAGSFTAAAATAWTGGDDGPHNNIPVGELDLQELPLGSFRATYIVGWWRHDVLWPTSASYPEVVPDDEVAQPAHDSITWAVGVPAGPGTNWRLRVATTGSKEVRYNGVATTTSGSASGLTATVKVGAYDIGGAPGTAYNPGFVAPGAMAALSTLGTPSILGTVIEGSIPVGTASVAFGMIDEYSLSETVPTISTLVDGDGQSVIVTRGSASIVASVVPQYQYTFADIPVTGAVTGSTTRRKHPNPTGQGVGPTRHWPLTRRGVTGIN